ncbi:hypothetical protein [Schleiferilactobacillus shenzhenensis]|nr:hypothetical protein [Schleiferilactobacillus shenzhenensis]
MMIITAHLTSVILNRAPQIDGITYWFTPYTQWISFNTDSWTIGFFLAMPILSVLSTSQILGEDVQSGFLMHILKRESLKKYLTINLLGSFTGGAVTVVVPLALDFLGVWSFFPSITPDRILNANMPLLPDFTYFHGWYYTHPFWLVAFYVVLAGAIAGLYALFSAVLALFFDNRFVSLGTAFMVTMILNVFATIAPRSVFSPVLISIGLSPLYIPPLVDTVIGYVAVLVGLVVLGIGGGIRRASM